MWIILLDTEQERLDRLEDLILEADTHAEIRKYLNSDDLFSAVREMEPDVAFLRVEMTPLNGIMIGRILTGMFPRINLIFVSKGKEFAAEALKLHASGYLMDQVREQDVKEELTGLRYPIGADTSVRASRGNGIYVGNELALFKYRKTFVLLEYLFRNKGRMCSTADIERMFWPEEERCHRSYLQNIITDLSSALEAAGCRDILIRRRGWIGVKENAVLEVAKMAG